MRYDEISLKVREIVANLFERDAATLSDDTRSCRICPVNPSTCWK